MSIKNLFYSSYWFNQPLILRGWELAVWLGSFLAIILVGLISLWLRHRLSGSPERNFYGKLSAAALTLGLWGLVWLLLRQERVYFLAWRFWLWLWLALSVLWAVHLIRYWFKRVPIIRQDHAARAAREKYLPGRV